MRNFVILLIPVLVIAAGFWGWNLLKKPVAVQTNNIPTNTQNSPTIKPSPTRNPNGLADPIADFKLRITKKFFGTLVSPQNSPVQPEKFTGYHSGVDVEYGDITEDVPVYAIADGEVISTQTASGYGGVMVEKFSREGQTFYAIYGHIRLSSAKKSSSVKKGEQIAVLGTAYSSETDGERRHLHFGIAKTRTILGYVQTKSALSNWLDPLSLYP